MHNRGGHAGLPGVRPWPLLAPRRPGRRRRLDFAGETSYITDSTGAALASAGRTHKQDPDDCMSTARPRRPRPQVMKLTESAAERIKALMADKGADTVGLRIGIKKGGCAGMEYTLEWATRQDPLDEVVEMNGAKVLVEPMAVMYLLGTEMDYRTDKLSAQFVFTNPNQTSACGCGESVNLAPVSAERIETLRT